MKALVFKGPKKVEMEEVNEQNLQDGDVRVNVKACGICGSDIHGFMGSGRRIAPMIMGHEFAGVITEIGENVKKFKIGDRVVVYPIIHCDKCSYCKEGLTDFCTDKKLLGVLDVNGAMVEYINVSEQSLFKIPGNVNFLDASLAEPLAVACAAVNKLTGKLDISRLNVLIVGSGPIGLLLFQVVKSKKPLQLFVSDISSNRLAVAKKLGAETVNPLQADIFEFIKNKTGRAGVDLSFEAVGITKTVDQAVLSLRKKGTSVWIGNSQKIIELDMQYVVINELNIMGSYVYSIKDFKMAVDLLKENAINSSGIISIVEKLSNGAEIFNKLVSGNDEIIKAILVN